MEKKPIKWLEEAFELDPINNEPCYSLDKLKSIKGVQIEYLFDDCFLATKREDSWLFFCLLDFCSSSIDDKQTLWSCVFHGEGPTDPLREPRHTYWGDNGYIFYMRPKVIIAGLKALEKYYDFY